MSKAKHQYSGNNSKPFWATVGKIKNDADRQEIYSLGVALQNMEENVLRILDNAQKSACIKTNKK